MCMEVGEYETAEFLRKHNVDEEITVWKLYRVVGKDVIPPFFHRNGCICPGKIVSNRKTRNCAKKPRYDGTSYPTVARGIHVYLTRKAARRALNIWFLPGRIFKCTAEVADLIAVGNYCNREEAVFMKIYISKEEFEKGKKGKN